MLTGNREYNEIYKKYKNLVLKVAYIYSGDNYDAAEDITQDTFLKLYIGFEELKDGNVSAWLYTTAKNSALNFNKKFKREVLSEDDELYKNKEQFGESLETEFIEKEEVLYKKQFHEKIMAALSKKNPRWYEAADRAVRLTQRRSNVPSHKNRGRCFLTPRTPYTRQEREARFRRIALSYVQYNFPVYRL